MREVIWEEHILNRKLILTTVWKGEPLSTEDVASLVLIFLKKNDIFICFSVVIMLLHQHKMRS